MIFLFGLIIIAISLYFYSIMGLFIGLFFVVIGFDVFFGKEPSDIYEPEEENIEEIEK
jgi:hypothetical protein